MQFSTVATVAAFAGIANAQYNSTTTATTTENQTTLVTITSCEENVCHETLSPALVSTATVTVDNAITFYTTWCPLSEEHKTSVATTAPSSSPVAPQHNTTTTSTIKENKTTLVTITSCEENVCHETLSPALVSTSTATVNNEVTVYTTWCPLSEEHKTSVSSATPVTSAETATKKTPEATTTTHKTSETTTAKKTSETTTAKVSSYTGAAAQALPAAGALVAGVAALLL